MSALVVQADARALPLPNASVDLVCTSPPYFALRSYTDDGQHYEGQIGSEQTPRQWLETMWECTREMMRVLKPEGSIWINLGDKYSGVMPGSYRRHTQPVDGGEGYHDAAADGEQRANQQPIFGIRAKSLLGLPWRYAIGCIDQLGLILRAEVIWSKPNGLPESVTDRVRRSHEQWFHFTRQPRYYAAVDEIREVHNDKAGPVSRFGKITQSGESRTDGIARPQTFKRAVRDYNPLGKLPGSVWTIPSEPLQVPPELGVDHFAAFPTEWPRRIILGWSPPGGRVADPFGGTGTTALVASVLGRVGVSVDRSADYCWLARWRTINPGERAKAMRVDKPPVQVDGQLDLLAVAV